jgi:predicted O-linked N-acetylglucosamine transferase (SPINDLY family)
VGASASVRKQLRQQHGLPVEGALMSGFNQLWKIDESLFRTWLTVLSATRRGEATLWLPLFPEVARPNLDRMAQQVPLRNAITSNA